MFWIILLTLLIALLIWILFAPIYLYLEWNDDRQRAELRWRGLIRVLILGSRKGWRVHVRILWFHRQWGLLELLARPSSSAPEKPSKQSRRSSWRPRHPLKMLRRLWRSFRIRQFRWRLDTDDYVLNAYLFPLFRITSRRQRFDWTVNFHGKNEVLLITENRLARMIYAVISSL